MKNQQVTWRQALSLLSDALGALLCLLLSLAGLALMLYGIEQGNDRFFLLGCAGVLSFGWIGSAFCSRGLGARERERN